MKRRLSLLRTLATLSFGLVFAAAARAQTGTALVRHAPSLNGTVQGSVQQMLGESVTLNGGATVTGDLLVPGTPTVRLNGKPTYAGTLDGTGSASPSNYQITLNGNSTLRNVVRRTNAIAIPAVAAPPSPTGTRSVNINSASDSPGSFTTVRNLTLNGNVGQFAIPPGTYGNFIANGGSGFTLGVAGATTPAIYNFQNLTFNGQTQILVVGPVIVTVANGFAANGSVGSSANSAWLTLNVYSGGFTLNGGCNFFGSVNAPNGTVIVNGNSQLIGGVTCDRLTVNGSGLLRLASAASSNHAPVANNLPVALDEDTGAAVTLTATDADGNALTYTTVTTPAHGTLSGTSPNLTYTPMANYNGPDSFTFKASDGQADSNVATVSITVRPINDRPTADAKPLVLAEDTPASVILSGVDIDGDALSFTVAVHPAHGTLSGTSPNLTYTPTANYSGPDSFTYTAGDGSLTSVPATVTITVTPVNDTPVALDAGYSVNEGATVAIALTGTDADGTALTFQRLTSTANGTLTGTAPNFVYQPNANFNGVDSFTFTAFDGQATSAPGTISINVVNLNFAPVAASSAPATDEDVPLVVTLAASDQDGDALAFSIVTQPQHGTLGTVASASGGTATVTYTPEANYHGADSFTFKARDTAFADSNVATVSLTVRPINDAPVATARSVQTDEDVALPIQLTGTDAEGSALTAMIVTQPLHGTLSPITVSAGIASVTYTPAADYNGPDSFTFKLNDGLLDSAPATISLTVRAINDAPVATAQSAPTDEDVPLVLTLAGTDQENSALTFTIVTTAQHGTLSPITPVSATTATVTYTPAPDYSGPDSFTFQASDGDKDSVPATVTLTVNPKNDAPVATGLNLQQPQDTPFNFTLPATDADGDALTYTIVTSPTNGALSGTAPNLTYTPAFNYRGGDSLVFKARDGQVDSGQATITFTMTPVSHPPVATSGSPVALDEDTTATITLPASDLDGNPLTYFIVTSPQSGTLSPITLNAGVATVVYTPTANYNGPDTFSFKANDGAADSNTATITLTVRSINDVPTASALPVSTLEDTPVNFTLTATDADGETLTYIRVTEPTKGTLSGTAPNLTYTPAPNTSGPDSFTFKVRDAALAESNIATVSIAVTAVNDAPIADAKSLQTDEDTPVVVALSATDSDSPTLTFTVVNSPLHGTFDPITATSATTATITYKPAANYSGPDSFTYKANDGALDSVPVTVSLTVRPVNDAPVATPASITTPEDTPKTITLAATDVEGDALTFLVIAFPQEGTLSGTAPNLTYTPNANYHGSDSFTFKVRDAGLAESSVETVPITVTPVNDAPVATNQSVAVPHNTPTTILLGATDLENDPLTFGIVGQPTKGIVAPSPQPASPNSFVYTPAPGFAGADSFTFKANDGALDSTLATVSLTVAAPTLAVNAGPDQPVTLPAYGSLAATVTYGGSGTLVLVWTQTAGPSGAVFESPSTAATRVSFPTSGSYTLRITASDGSFSAFDEVVVTVNASTLVFRTYTTSADFALGSNSNVNSAIADQLQLNADASAGHVFWVANSSKGTVVKINTRTGRVEGEYRTAPQGQPLNPSRTTVDLRGAVWCSNRDGNSIVQIGSVESGLWIDKNGNGQPDTSIGLNDLRGWSNAGGADTAGGVSTAEDECIIHYVRVSAGGTRHLSVDKNNNVWVSGTGGAQARAFNLIDGRTGAILRTEGPVGYGGYGGLLDRNGVIWSTTYGSLLYWNTALPLSGANGDNWSTLDGSGQYGLAIDRSGYVWASTYASGPLRKYAPDGSLVATYSNPGSSASKGICVDAASHLWIAEESGNGVSHFRPDGFYLGTVPVGGSPTGVAVDADGKVWGTTHNGFVFRLNPAGGSPGADGSTPLGAVEFTSQNLGGDLYNYSDMTGSNLIAPPLTGVWTVVFDSNKTGAEWGSINWHAQIVNDSKLSITVASSVDGLAFSPWRVGVRGQDLDVPAGRYLKVNVLMQRSTSGHSPVLYDLTVGEQGYLPDYPFNQGPAIEAASPQAATHGIDAKLQAKVTDDGLPHPGNLTYSWTKISGPGAVSFDNANRADATATFAQVGNYVLRLTATDGVVSATKDVNVIANLPPTATAGPDLGVRTAGGSIALRGSVFDDSANNGGFNVSWSQLAGPATATFAMPSSPTSTVTLPALGRYVFQLTADDGWAVSRDIMQVRVGPTVSAEVPVDMAAFWPFDEGTADLIHGHVAALHRDATLSDGIVGRSVHFDGTGDNAIVSAHSDIDLGASAAGFTVEFWAKPGQSQVNTILSWGAFGGTAGLEIYQNGATITANLRERSTGAGATYDAGGALTTGQWTHYALTLDRTAGEVRLYVNGALNQLYTGVGNRAVRTQDDLTLARHAWDANYPWMGALDELTFYKRPLSYAEIAAIVATGAGGKNTSQAGSPPVVDAGPDRALATTSAPTTLTATLTDDNPAEVNVGWSTASGPTNAVFVSPNALTTLVSFPLPGVYLLKLDAEDLNWAAKPDYVEVRVGGGFMEPPSGISAWWPGNGHPREIVKGNHNMELINGAGYTTGKVAQAFTFDGQNDYGVVPAHADIDPGASAAGFTIEFWVKPGQSQVNSILSWGTFGGAAGLEIYQNGATITANLRERSTGAGATYDAGGALTTGQWTHYALTLDRTAGEVRLYVNGVLNQTFTGVGNRAVATQYGLTLGRHAWDTFYPWLGALDELTLYTRPLTIAEVAAVYSAGAAGKTPPDDNLPPVVSAGPDVVLAGIGATATLSGSAPDDNKPFGAPIVTWSKVDGPAGGEANFADSTLAATTAMFTVPGTYLLKLTATDGYATPVSDLMEVRVGVNPITPVAGIAAWWPGNGHAREIVKGNVVAESYNGAGYTAGQVSQAFNFDGVNDHLRVQAHADHNIATSAAGFTIEFWARPTRSANQMFLAWASPAANGLRVFQTGTTLQLWGGSLLISYDGILVNAWAHYAVTYDKVTGWARIYRNGLLAAESNIGTPALRTDLPLTFGHSLNEVNFLYQGQLDELTLYTRPLAISEVAAIYSAGAAGKAPDDNLPPVVSAGPDVVLAGIGATATLSGSAPDDNKPFGAPTVTWSKVDGPVGGEANFADATRAATTATFTVSGTYLLKLTATDGYAAPVSDLMEVRVGVNPIAPAADIAAWWPGNGESREVVRGNHDVEFYNGASYGTGKVSQAFAFDGVNDYGRVAAHSDLNIGASPAGYTIELWMNPDVLRYAPLVQWDNGAAGLALWTDPTGQKITAFTGGGDFSANGAAQAGVWSHIALTYDKPTGAIRIYRDGVLAGSGSSSAGFTPRTDYDLYFGSVPRYNGAYAFVGKMDEVSFYNRPLSVTELLAIYNAGAAGKQPPVVNFAPVVNAGADKTAFVNVAVSLTATATDDGLPNPPAMATYQWTKISGPSGGNVSVTAPTALTTSATFDTAGTYVLRLTASDSVLTGFDEVAIAVTAPPSVSPSIAIFEPAAGTTLGINTYFEIAATATDSDGTIAKVEFFQGTTKLGEQTLPEAGHPTTYFWPMTGGLPAGTYTFTAKATDNSGATATSAPASITVSAIPSSNNTVYISTPEDSARVSAPTTVTGLIVPPGLTSWLLQSRLRPSGDDTSTSAEPWLTVASGSTPVGTAATATAAAVPGPIGTFDPTLLLNGLHELRLSVTTSTTLTTTSPLTLVVEGNMKVGAFTLAFEDLKVPVAGIPITLTRTYDSRDTRVGDFGPGWRLALANIRVQKNRNLGAGWYQTPQSGSGIQFYNVDPVGDRIVTVVMPDGESHRFKLGAYVKKRIGDPDDASFAVVVTQGQLRFYPLGDTTSKLEPLDAAYQLNDHFYIGGTGDQDITSEDPGSNPFASPYNTSRFRLTTKDGTVFILDEALGLLSMTDLSGNTLVLDRNGQNLVTGVTSTQNAPGGPVVSSVTIVRDATGRVDYIRDAAGKDLDYIYDTSGRLASFTNRELNVTQFRYENAAFPYYLTKIIDPRGVSALRTEFGTDGRMVKQIDADGKETLFTRGTNATGRFEKVKDRLGNESTFYYDDRGNVTLKIDPLSAQTSFSYWPDSDRVKTETDHYGNVKSMAYDTAGNVLVQTVGANAAEDPAAPTTGHITRTTYNARSGPTQITDPAGRVQTFTYDPVSNNLLTHTIGADPANPAIGDKTTYTYNTDGTLATITDALGNVTGHTYNYAFSDAAYPGAVKQITVTVTDPAGAAGSDPANATATVLRSTRTLLSAQENQLAQIATRHLPDGSPQDVITRYTYDTENRLVATIMPDGRVAETRYTSFGKEDKTALWRTFADYTAHVDANARLTSYGYDSRGNQTSVTHADGTTEAMSFDLENRKTWSQDRRGYRTFFLYDAVGRLRFTIAPDANDGVGAAAPTTATDPRLANNPRTETVYDLAGRVTDTYDALRHRSQTVYFPDGTPDASRRKQMVQVRSIGNLITTYAYDQTGNVRFVTDPRGNATETIYDTRGRPTTVVYPATDEHPATQATTTYDVLGRRVATTDQENRMTRFRYDGLGRLVEVRQYLDQSLAAGDAAFSLAPTVAGVVSTRYTHDELGNQQTQTDALGRVTTYVTDQLGRRTSRILPKDATEATFLTETLQYDEWGNLWKRTDFAGKTTTFGYDTLNRLKSKTADATHPSLGYSHAIARIEFDYDANGARTAARTFNAANTQLYTESTPRDERGRLTYKDTAAGRLDYGYYANNLLKDTVSSNSGGVNVGYRYDELNRLESVDDTSTGLPTRTTGYTYNANGSLETVTQPNAVVHTYGYDALNRLRGLVVSRSTTLIHTYEYKLNPTGHRHQVVEDSTKTTTYGYDDIYRLTGETVVGDSHANNGEIGYVLDKVGNRQSRTSQLAALNSQLGLTYNARDWIGTDTHTANGSTQVGQVSDLSLRGTDAYDFEEHLILRTKTDGSTINVSYNADGHRIQKNILDATAQPISTTSWLVDANNLTGYAQVVEERVTVGGATPSSLIRTYTYGSSLISQATSLDAAAATLSYYTHDGHGNVRELTDATSSVTDRYDYDAFGNLGFSSGTTANAYRYCGEQYDADLGLYYNRARYLNPDSGRFWSMDDYEGKSEDPLSLHKYLYAHANPVSGIDPSGQNTISLPAITMTVGVVGILQKIAVVSLVATLVELPFRSWTIWVGAETTAFHAYFVAKHRDGRTFRYDVRVARGQWARALQNPFKHYTATVDESAMPFSEAMTGARAPVGRLSERTYRFWSAQIPRGPIDYVLAYKNCYTYSALFAAKAAILTLLPF